MPRKKIKDKLTRFRGIFFREKYRFDQGNAFLVFINFSLLVTTLVAQVGGDIGLIKYYILCGFAATWLLGYFLDKVVKIQDIQERVVLQRSPIWQDVFKIHDRHNQKFELLIARLERLEKNIDRIERKMQK